MSSQCPSTLHIHIPEQQLHNVVAWLVVIFSSPAPGQSHICAPESLHAWIFCSRPRTQSHFLIQSPSMVGFSAPEPVKGHIFYPRERIAFSTPESVQSCIFCSWASKGSSLLLMRPYMMACCAPWANGGHIWWHAMLPVPMLCLYDGMLCPLCQFCVYMMACCAPCANSVSQLTGWAVLYFLFHKLGMILCSLFFLVLKWSAFCGRFSSTNETKPTGRA